MSLDKTLEKMLTRAEVHGKVWNGEYLYLYSRASLERERTTLARSLTLKAERIEQMKDFKARGCEISTYLGIKRDKPKGDNGCCDREDGFGRLDALAVEVEKIDLDLKRLILIRLIF